MVPAVACPADRADDLLGVIYPQHAAVDDVGDLDLTVGEQVRVVGVGEVTGRAALAVVVPVLPDDPRPAGERDNRDRFREFLIGADVAPIRRDERIIRLGEVGGGGIPSGWELPDDPSGRVEHDHSVVIPVGDHQVAGQR